MFRAIQRLTPLFQRSMANPWVRPLSTAAPQQVVTVLKLNNLYDNEGAVKKKRRVGRGCGSSKGKTSGRGHKGQKARSGGKIHPLFEGGQMPFFKRIPKKGYKNRQYGGDTTSMVPLNIVTLQNFIDMKRVSTDGIITIREMIEAGMFNPTSIKNGVKLLAHGKEAIKQPIHIEISRASTEAIAAIEATGGTVTTVHYNKLALRQLMKPHKFEIPIKQARPPPKLQPYYTSWTHRGYLNPQVQMRNFFREKSELRDKFVALQNESTDS